MSSSAGITSEPLKVIHFVSRGASVENVLRFISIAAEAQYDTGIIAVADGIQFESFPGNIRHDAWTLDELDRIVSFARLNSMNVIPEVKLLTHQEKLFQSKHPQLMHNSVTYDPRKP